jgi:uncharacterized cupin superfamily protein
MSSKTHPNVVRASEVVANEYGQGDFQFTMRRLGAAAKGLTLGVAHMEVPPGKTAFPYHFHSACEEGVYILDGEGTVRIGADSIAVTVGDYIAFPPGPDAAHQLSNTGTTTLRYLAMSAPAVYLGMDVVGFPDSNKQAFFSGVKPGAIPSQDGGWVARLIKADRPDAQYYDDEPLAQK